MIIKSISKFISIAVILFVVFITFVFYGNDVTVKSDDIRSIKSVSISNIINNNSNHLKETKSTSNKDLTNTAVNALEILKKKTISGIDAATAYLNKKNGDTK